MARDGTAQVRTSTAFWIKIGETVLEQRDRPGVASVVFEDHVELVDMLVVRLEGRRDERFRIGDPVEFRVEADSDTLFRGYLTALEPSFRREGGYTLLLRALDPLHVLGRGRRSRYWENVRDSDVVAEVGAESGLSVEVEETSEVLPYVFQRNESNVALLKRLAARNGFVLRVEDGVLRFQESRFTGQVIELEYGKDIVDFHAVYDSMEQVSSVVVRGWDPSRKEEVVGEATASDVDRLGDGELGLELVRSAFGDSTAYITDVPVASQGHAQAIAQAELERLARRFARGTVTVAGNDQLRAGCKLRFSGLGAPWDGEYLVAGTRHRLSPRSGYVTEASFYSNSFGSAD